MGKQNISDKSDGTEAEFNIAARDDGRDRAAIRSPECGDEYAALPLTRKEAKAAVPTDMAVAGEEDGGVGVEYLLRVEDEKDATKDQKKD